MTLASPCIGVCNLDDATGYCLGCARTTDEIANWHENSPDRRAEIMKALPLRFQELGVTWRRLPWTTREVRDFVASSLYESAGTWIMGVVGGVAEFASLPGKPTTVETDGDRIEASNAAGRLQITINSRVFALTVDPAISPEGRARIILAVLRKPDYLPVSETLTDLGTDDAAINPDDREQRLYDLGLGREEARFCVRCGPGAAKAALADAAGSTLADALPRVAPALLRESPTRVVESAIGRIEVTAPIPEPDGKSPHGPHTHLLPDHLATGRALPVGMDIPLIYQLGAIFYPEG